MTIERERVRARRAFTLVELLIVIGIIAVLIAILFPTLNRARRSAVVLASPVVYLGSDSAIHLTDPSGRSDLVLNKGAYKNTACPVCHSPPAWSPLGTKIGIRAPGRTGGSFAGVVEPMTGRVKLTNDIERRFVGWLDSNRYLQANNAFDLTIVNVDTNVEQPVTNSSQIVFISTAPVHCSSPYIGAMIDKSGRFLITFIRKDLTPGKPVWREPTAPPGAAARVDPQGEFVAWTSSGSGGAKVAVKSVKDLSTIPPTLLGTQFTKAYFCDWTEGGDLLANVSAPGGKWKLVVLGRDGSVRSELGLSIPPAEGVIASWRKYEHR